MGKGEIAPFPTVFSTQSDNCIPFCSYFYIISLFAAELEEPKICISGKGLKVGFFVLFFREEGFGGSVAAVNDMSVIIYLE